MANGGMRDRTRSPLRRSPPSQLPEWRSVRWTYHRLRMVGLTPTEAGNLTAHLNGLRIADEGWTLREVERLLFVRALAERGRIPP